MPQLEIDKATSQWAPPQTNGLQDLRAAPFGFAPQNGQQVENREVAAIISDDNNGNGGALKLDIPAPIKASDEDSASIPEVSDSSIEYMDPFKAILEQPSKSAARTSTPLSGAASNHNRSALLIPQPKTPSIPQSFVPISKRSNYVHFNSKGEIIVEPSPEAIAEPIKPPALLQTPYPNKPPPVLQNPYPNPNVNIRVCMKFGCGSLIRPENQEAFCARCTEAGVVDLVSIAKSHARPLPADNLKDNPYMRLVKNEPQTVDIDMDLGYPEDAIVPSNAPKSMQSRDTKSEPPFTNAPLVRLAPKVSQKARRPDASSGKKRQRLEVASQGHLLPKPQMPPVPSSSTSSTLPPFVGTPARAVPLRRHPSSKSQYSPQPSQSGLKNCATPGCTGLIHMQSAAKRCTPCVMKDWKGKAAKVKAAKEKVRAQQPLRSKTPPPVPGPSSTAAPTPATPSTSLADIIQKAFQLPGSGSSTPTKMPKNKVTADESTSNPKTCSAEENAHKRVFLRIPSKRKLEEMIDLTRNSSSPSPVKQAPLVEDSAEIEQKPVLLVTPRAIEKPSPAAVPPDEGAMDVDGNSAKAPPLELSSLPPVPKANGKEKMKANDVDPDDKTNSLLGWDSDLTSLSELERCGDTTDEEDEPASSKLVIRLPPRSYSHLPPEQRPNPPGTHYRVNGIGYGVLGVARPTEGSSTEEALASMPQTALPQFKVKLYVPPQELPPGTRTCAIPKCKEPLAEGYKWKCCRSCRHHHREYQRKRLGITKGSYSTSKEELKPEVPPPTVVVTKSHGTPVTLAAGSRICVIKNCGLVIPPVEEYKFKLCRECRKRTNKTRQRRQLRAEGKEDPELDKEIELMRARWKQRVAAQAVVVPAQQQVGVRQEAAAPPAPPEAKVRTPAYPEYSALPLLVNDFSQRIAGFFEGQALYAVHHHPPTADPGTMLSFGFDGEYSVVAMDMEIEGRKEAIMDFVGRVKAELERVGGLEFDSRSRLVSYQHGGILTRYACRQAVGPIVMRGELEIAILPEYTHRFFPGQRTVVRFRMVG